VPTIFLSAGGAPVITACPGVQHGRNEGCPRSQLTKSENEVLGTTLLTDSANKKAQTLLFKRLYLSLNDTAIGYLSR